MTGSAQFSCDKQFLCQTRIAQQKANCKNERQVLGSVFNASNAVPSERPNNAGGKGFASRWLCAEPRSQTRRAQREELFAETQTLRAVPTTEANQTVNCIRIEASNCPEVGNKGELIRCSSSAASQDATQGRRKAAFGGEAAKSA